MLDAGARLAVAAVLLAGSPVGALRLQAPKHSSTDVAPQGAYRQVLYNYQNVQYYGEFDLGGQTIKGIFDTGSFELLVRSRRCESCAHPTPPYDFKQSKTYVKNGTVEQHVFGSGPCISMMGYETVSVGPMSAPRQAFWEIVNHRIPVLDRAKFAAIVGIGPSFAYGNAEKTLLMSYGVEEFSVCLKKESGSNGYLTWGPVASEETKKSQFISAPVIGKHHWATKMTSVYFGEQGGMLTGTRGPCFGSGCAAIIDSGTSLIAAPGIALMQLSEMVEPIQEDCSNLDKLPDLHFTINGESITLPPQAWVMRITGSLMEANNIWDILFFKPKVKKLNMCMPAFMQMDMMSQYGPVWIIGMPFFRYYHSSFNRVDKKMYFAKAGNDCEAEPLKSSNRTGLIATKRRVEDYRPLDVEIDQLVPPTLSSMLDFPFDTQGEVEL